MEMKILSTLTTNKYCNFNFLKYYIAIIMDIIIYKSLLTINKCIN